MKSKPPASTKKPSVALKDLKTKHNPKGGIGGTVTKDSWTTKGANGKFSESWSESTTKGP